jgi:hypothetical protein
MILGIGSFLTLALSLIGITAVSFDYYKPTILAKVSSGVFFLFILVSQIIFVGINTFFISTYILVQVVLLFYLLDNSWNNQFTKYNLTKKFKSINFNQSTQKHLCHSYT